jgi:hypothetical protein
LREPDVDTGIVRRLVERTARRIQPPPGGAKAAISRARKLRRLQVVGTVVVSLVVVVAIALPLIGISGLQRDGASPRRTSPAEVTTLDEGGIQLTVPPGWHGRADFLPGYTRKIFQAATLPLPPLSDDEATTSRSLIGPDDVLIVIVEHQDPCGGPDPMFPRIPGPLTVEARDFESPHDVCDPPLPALRDVSEDHALARKTFELEGRLFDLRVEFGTRLAPEGLLAQVNEILGSFTVGRYEEVPDGICRRHELGFGDPDCPEPQWVRGILEETGYEVVDSSGVFVGRSAETEFFVWAEELTDDHTYQLNELGYPQHERVDGISVFGGQEEWRWRVQGLEVSVAQGPDGDSIFPTFEQIEPLVRASIETPYEG